MSHNYYLTTTLPYVNADPHIGFALEIVQADVLARYHRLLGDAVIFNTGTDEHGLKIYRKAQENHEDPQAYCDRYAAKFDALKQALNLSYTNFIRTTDPHHIAAAQEFWKLCEKNGDIYKKSYQVKYCVGCELEKTDSELVDGKCPVHPNLELELINEENYFFKFSKYQPQLLKLYQDQPNFVVPGNRLNEIVNFVKSGLEDFSISRLASKMPWGIPVPGDDNQVMYVWFDALINYISTLGWGQSVIARSPKGDEAIPSDFDRFWPGYQVAGKDNLRQQSAMWQAMLMSAGLPTSEQIFIHGFITADGQKISKSLGNVVDPFGLVKKYGTDAVRYYLLGALPSYEDGDFSEEKFRAFYGAQLANGVGNLNSRILTMIENYSDGRIKNYESRIKNGDESVASYDLEVTKEFWQEYENKLKIYRFDLAVEMIAGLVGKCDKIITNEKPWEKAKKGEDISELLYKLAETMRHIGVALLPVMPTTAEKILGQFGIAVDWNKFDWKKMTKWGLLKSGTKITKSAALFPRL